MTRKIVATLIGLLALAALSPAPIKDPRAALNEELPHSQAQVAQEQKMDGTLPVVGKVPIRTYDNGTSVVQQESDPDAKDALINADLKPSDPNAVANLQHVQAQLAAKNSKGTPVWILALICFAIGLALVQAVKLLLNRLAPVPGAHVPQPTKSTKRSYDLDKDEAWN